MRSGSRTLALSTLAVSLLLQTPTIAQQPLPGTDIRTWATANISSKLSFIGTWQPMDTSAQFIPPFWGLVKLGPEQRDGIALASWGYLGSFQSTAPDSTPTRVAILAQQPDGTLADATPQNPTTGGIGSVIAADFNGDGLEDVVFSAHNESPFVLKPSVAFMSQPDGSLSRIVLPDAVMNHDAQLYRVNGVNKIISSSYGTVPQGGTVPQANYLYTWSGSNFTVKKFDEIGAMSTLAGRFSGGLDEWLVVTDSHSSPDRPYSRTNLILPYAYKFNNQNVVLPAIRLPKPYFNDRPEYAQFVSHWDPYGKSHTVRARATDLNQDGLLDIVAISTIWSSTGERHQKGVLQELINRGNMQFGDDTDALSPGLSKDPLIDYSTQFRDVDGSGIETILAASSLTTTTENDALKQGQFIIVNDGTGRFSAAMHDEFKAMTAQVVAYARPRLPAGYSANSSITPMFIPYRTPEGRINFAAVIKLNGPALPAMFAFVNVPLGINLTTDFRQDMVVGTRHGSRRIRTFAGNDTIHRGSVGDPDCAIDGGLGTNVAVYPGPRAAWSVTRGPNDTVIMRPAQGAGGVDTLTRIQIARFADSDLDLTQ